MRGMHTILWNATENVGQDDLNKMQRFDRAQSFDWAIAAMGRMSSWYGSAAPSHVRTSQLFTLGDSLGPSVSATARTINVNSGLAFQWKTGSPAGVQNPLDSPAALPSDWGDDSYALGYYATNNEFQTLHDVGDATNPRWDVVSLSFTVVDNDAADQETRLQKQLVGSTYVISSGTFVKRRKIVVTKTVTKGTPAATPNIPLLPAGNVPVYAVYVAAAMGATAFSSEQVWDFRMPLGMFCVDMLSSDSFLRGQGEQIGSMSLTTAAFGGVTAGHVSAKLYHPVMGHSQHSARLIGVDLILGPSNATAEWRPIRLTTNGAASNGVAAVSIAPGYATAYPAQSGLTSGAASHARLNQAVLNLDAFTNSAGGLARPPVWINGTAGGYAKNLEQYASVDDTFSRLGIQWTSNDVAAVIHMIRARFAGGPF